MSDQEDADGSKQYDQVRELELIPECHLQWQFKHIIQRGGFLANHVLKLVCCILRQLSLGNMNMPTRLFFFYENTKQPFSILFEEQMMFM